LLDKNVPACEPSGLCKYCRYQTKCYNDGNGLTDKPLSTPEKNATELSYTSRGGH